MRFDVTWLGYFMAPRLASTTSRSSRCPIDLFARRDPLVDAATARRASSCPPTTKRSSSATRSRPSSSSTTSGICVIVVNDGSTDRTGERARAVRSVAGVSSSSIAHPRSLDMARARAERGLPRARRAARASATRCVAGLRSRTTSSSASSTPTATLEPDALDEVARLFADSRVGGVQMGVIIGNARRGPHRRAAKTSSSSASPIWPRPRGPHRLGRARRQRPVHAHRGRFASSDSAPWSDCLTEDLDLGLHLTRRGWTHPLLPNDLGDAARRAHGSGLAAPAHALGTRSLPVLGARPAAARRAGNVRLSTRLDLVLYLLFVAFVMFVAANLADRAFSGRSGCVTVVNEFLAFLPAGPLRNVDDARDRARLRS